MAAVFPGPEMEGPSTLSARLIWRASIVVLVLAGEAILASLLFDSMSVFRWAGTDWSLRLAAASLWIAKFLIGFATIFGTFLFLRFRPLLVTLAGYRSGAVSKLESLHFASLAAFFVLSSVLSRSPPGSSATWAVALLWLTFGILILVSAGFVVLPARVWRLVISKSGALFWFAVVGATAATSIVSLSRQLWVPTSEVTFRAVEWVLRPVLHDMVVDPAHMRIGSTRCTAIISPECSGLEGVSLMIVFLSIWLVLFRKTLRFPRALVVIPVGTIILLYLNVLRIAGLILIGHAGYRNIAAQGFHSEAGWILFNLVAFGVAVGARRLSWLSTVVPEQQSTAPSEPDGTTAYLAPFLALVAAGMLAHAASGGFDWWYGIRLFAGAATLWWFRRSYGCERLWNWNGTAVGTGLVVFLLWIAIAKWSPWSAKPAVMPRELLAALGAWRACWIAIRLVTAVLVVPFAEELAFRGFLSRRFTAKDWESVRPQDIRLPAVLGSCALFGILHGTRWLEAALAGAAFVWVYRRRGSLADAITAHATANLLVGMYVLLSGEWSLW